MAAIASDRWAQVPAGAPGRGEGAGALGSAVASAQPTRERVLSPLSLGDAPARKTAGARAAETPVTPKLWRDGAPNWDTTPH